MQNGVCRTGITAMKVLFNILFFILPTLILSSCAVDDFDYTQDGDYYFSSLEANQFVPVYGTVNGKDNISIIATGNYFEVSGFPSDDIMKYLDSFGAAEIVLGTTVSNTLSNVLRDLIPYRHNAVSADGNVGKKISLEVLPHTMSFMVGLNGTTQNVEVYFEPKGSDNYMMYTSTTSGYCWVYNFTITAVKMAVDGNTVADFKGSDYEFRIYYQPSKN